MTMARLSIAGLYALVLLATPVVAADAPPGSGGLAPPKVDFIYPSPNGPIFDIICPDWIKQDIARRDIDETIRRLPEFKAAWNRDGLRYMRMVLKETGRPFPYREMQATLSICAPDSIGMPLLISLREILSSNTKPFAHDFALLVFHETMHSYAMAIADRSALLREYADLPPDIRDHLHVVAAEQFVLKRTGNVAGFERLRDYYAKLDNDTYRRAWAIVEKETPEAFMADIRAIKD